MNKYREDILLFYSRSADRELRYLSNFQECEINIFYFKFPSVEHGFQAMKYVISGHIEYALEFQTGKKYGVKPANLIKKEGGKTGFKNRKVSLNLEEWKKYKKDIMVQFINIRYTVDEKFRLIVDKIRSKKLFHFENVRGRKTESYWGGTWPGEMKKSLRNETNFKGKNMLGKIILKCKICDFILLKEEIKKIK